MPATTRPLNRLRDASHDTFQSTPISRLQNTTKDTSSSISQNTSIDTSRDTSRHTFQAMSQDTPQATVVTAKGANTVTAYPKPDVFNNMPLDLYQKITQPLPSKPLKYDPNDIMLNEVKPNVLDNTFFPNNLKQMLSSDIGVGNKKITQKQSGKLSLDI